MHEDFDRNRTLRSGYGSKGFGGLDMRFGADEKENNNKIRSLTGEYKQIEPECREGIREMIERMKKLCEERNSLYKK